MGLFVNHPGLVTLLLAYIALLVLIIVVTLKEYRPMSFFRKDQLERALRTAGQVVASMVIVVEVLGMSLQKWDGKVTLGSLAVVLSFAMSQFAKRVGDPGDASLVSGTPEG